MNVPIFMKKGKSPTEIFFVKVRISGVPDRIYNENFITNAHQRISTYINAYRTQAKKGSMSRIKLRRLLSKLKAGKKEYFEEFYELTKGAVWYVVGKYVKERFFAEDILQDAYVSFLNNLASVKEDPLPYLCSIAKNKALDSIKKEAKIDKSLTPEDLNSAASDIYEIEYPLLEICRKKLSKEEFFIIENTVIYGYTRVEVAKMLEKPVSTVNRQYNALLKRVKTLAEEAYR